MDFTIDKHRLDEACIKQAEMAGELSQRMAPARQALAEAKNAVGLAKAEAANHIRLHPEMYDIGKVTDSSVADAMLMQDSVQEAQAAVVQAQYIVDVLDAGREALNDRKYAVRDLVELWRADYYADTPMPGAGRTADQRDANHAEVAERSQRRRVRPEGE